MDQDEAAFLAAYDIKQFAVPLTTVDVVIFTLRDERLHVLLVQRSAHPHRGMWSLPGGFIDVGRDVDLEGAALRKLREKTGVSSPYLEQLETYGDRKRDPRGWAVTVAYFALVNEAGIRLQQGEGAREVAWFPVHGDEVGEALAFDHQRILRAAVQRLRAKVEYTALAAHLLPESFTLTELQHVFEIILGQSLEKSAFRRRIREASVVEAIPGQMRHGSNRPAQLYRRNARASSHLFIRNLTGNR